MAKHEFIAFDIYFKIHVYGEFISDQHNNSRKIRIMFI